jgi:F-type H+-transporting ATPase subunit c
MIEALYIIFSMIPAIFATLGTSIGQGLIGRVALQAMHKQPEAANNIAKVCIIGIAITETAAIMGFVISILLLATDLHSIEFLEWAIFGIAGIAAAVGISGLCAGIASALPAMAACRSLARQPFHQAKLLNLMLITQTLIMTPNIFSVFIALLIKGQLATVNNFNGALKLLSSGLCLGLGCIGPSIGLCLFAFAACNALGINKKAYGKIITFTFICEAIIETPMIFSLLISLIILTTEIIPMSDLQGWQFLAAALCMGLSTISPGINSGRTGASACNNIALHLDQYPSLSKITMLALAMIDSFAIYGLLISIVMLMFS